MSNLPVVFFHLGSNDYFDSAVNIAARNNFVLHVGDIPLQNPPSEKYEFVDYSLVTQDFDEFMNRYIHMHPRVGLFEHVCFLRWIALRNVMKLKGIPFAFYADSDVAVLEDITKTYEEFERPEIAYSIPHNDDPYYMVGCGHSSFWSLNGISRVCDYIFDSYRDEKKLNVLKDKWRHHQEGNVPGGVCDMTVLYMFSQENEVFRTNKVFNSATFDHCVTISENYTVDEFVMEGPIKKIGFDKNSFFGLSKSGQEPIRFRGIHCQGSSKPLMMQIESLLKGQIQ